MWLITIIIVIIVIIIGIIIFIYRESSLSDRFQKEKNEILEYKDVVNKTIDDLTKQLSTGEKTNEKVNELMNKIGELEKTNKELDKQLSENNNDTAIQRMSMNLDIENISRWIKENHPSTPLEDLELSLQNILSTTLCGQRGKKFREIPREDLYTLTYTAFITVGFKKVYPLISQEEHDKAYEQRQFLINKYELNSSRSGPRDVDIPPIRDIEQFRW